MLDYLNNTTDLVDHLVRTLNEKTGPDKIFRDGGLNRQTSAGVILLLGKGPTRKHFSNEPCLVLNKRSFKVKQPGDLCFPGGSIAPRFDAALAAVLALPITPLGRWPYWSRWKRNDHRAARSLALLWATGLRESLEEIRLNPFGLKFLGPLPPQNLVMFRRRIYPLAAWTHGQKKFFPNWEVEKIIHIPLREFLKPNSYRRYRLKMQLPADDQQSTSIRDFPCFEFQHKGDREVLWGATFWITVQFLEYSFGFKLPDPATLPVIEGRLDSTYLSGPEQID